MQIGDPEGARHLALALKDAQVVESTDGGITLRLQAVGDLTVTSGSVVACDPKWLEEAPQPFLTHIEPGRYPVILSIAHFPDGDQRVAYATLRFRERQPVRWKVARRQEDDADGDIYASAYSVDSGKGCFMDADLLHLLVERIAAEAADETNYECMNIGPGYEEGIDEVMARTRVRTWGWANICPEPDTTSNVIVFSSGLGDGAYLTYVGYDADAVPVCFTTDFALFEDESEE